MNKQNHREMLVSCFVLVALVGCTALKTSTPTSEYPMEIPVAPSLFPYPMTRVQPTPYLPPILSSVQPPRPTETVVVYTPVPPTLIAAFPEGAVPLMKLAWSLYSGCGQNITLIPYRIADRHQSLAAIQEVYGTYSLFWDWQQESVGPDDWEEIRPLTNNPILQNGIMFLGLDHEGHWQIGFIADYCHRPVLWGLIPVSSPEHAFSVTSQFSQIENTPREFWVVDDGVLNVYHWINNRAVKHWSLEDLPGDALIPFAYDITLGGSPEWILQWWWQGDPRDWRDSIQAFQIVQTDLNGFRVIGELAPDMQQIDLDGDNVPEFLQPQQMPEPQQWHVYRWMGDHFDWGETLSRQVAPTPQVPNRDNLPPIPIDFYFSSANTSWRWHHEGGPLQSVNEIPLQPSYKTCTSGQTAQEVVSWSSQCNYAIIHIQGIVEGGSYGILNMTNGQLNDIPDSFVYVRGNSTFAWDPNERFVIHARSDSPEGLYRIDLDSGATRALVGISSSEVLALGQHGHGAVSPVVLQDGSVIFSIQGTANTAMYPPLGIYRITQEGQLTLLTAIPALEAVSDEDSPVYYGSLLASPDGSMYLYRVPLTGYTLPPYRALILGITDGSARWSLLEFADVKDFQWSSR